MLPTVEELRAGHRRAIARAITALENGHPQAAALRQGLAEHTGAAHVIGVTGPPGGGKSTLVAALIRELRRHALTVAVVAVDPSSPITGGAVLGDRIRMGEQQDDPGVFIRSLASRGHLGGLSLAARDVVDVFDVAGYDIVLVETVGAGQSEVEVTTLADTRLVACPPGLGDDVQAIKAGMMEIADAFVVTKGDLPDAGRTERDLHGMLALRRGGNARPPVFRTQATSGEGLQALGDWLRARTARGTRLGDAAQRRALRVIRQALAGDGMAATMGMELVSGSLEHATVRMRIDRRHMNFNGRCHGGAIFSLADMALGLACNSAGELAALIDGHISVSTPVEEGQVLEARAEPVHLGRKLGVYRVEVTRVDDGRHIANLNSTVFRTGRPVATGT